MSNIGHFSDAIVFSARGASFRTIFRGLRERAAGDAEIGDLLRREEEFDAIGDWGFESLSLPSLLILQELVDAMARDPEAATPHWLPEGRPLFVSDLRVFREKLAERLALT
jgi:hypothetical protein